MIRAAFIAACRWLVSLMPAETFDHIENNAYQAGRNDERQAWEQLT